MENKGDINKGTGGRIALVGAIITAIAGIVTTLVSISGPILDRKLAIETTQTREAFILEATRGAGAATPTRVTPTPLAPASMNGDPTQTDSPNLPADPTFTPVPFSAEAQPTASPPAAEAMLKVGDNWVVGNGLTVQLTNIEFLAGNQIKIHFAFINTSKKVMNIAVNHTRDVTLSDDKGNVYTWSTDFTWEITSDPGTTRKDTVVKSGDVSRASYFIVKLELPGIGSMQWKD